MPDIDEALLVKAKECWNKQKSLLDLDLVAALDQIKAKLDSAVKLIGLKKTRQELYKHISGNPELTELARNTAALILYRDSGSANTSELTKLDSAIDDCIAALRGSFAANEQTRSR